MIRIKKMNHDLQKRKKYTAPKETQIKLASDFSAVQAP
jgi:hypothetical protein